MKGKFCRVEILGEAEHVLAGEGGKGALAALDNLPVAFDLLLAGVPVGSDASNLLSEGSLDAGVRLGGDFEGSVLAVDAGEGALGPLAVVDRESVALATRVAHLRLGEGLVRREGDVTVEGFREASVFGVPLRHLLVGGCLLALDDDTAGLSVFGQGRVFNLLGWEGHVGLWVDAVAR